MTAAGLLTACAYVTKTHAPDGSEAYAINCSGTAMGWDACYKKAGDLCGASGYEELRKDGDMQATAGGSAYGAFGAQSANRSMLIKCRA